MIHEVSYNSLPRKRRRELHQRALDALEMLFGDNLDQHYGVLAHHAQAAGNSEKALVYHRSAGDAARTVYAMREATEHYSEALKMATSLGKECEEAVVGDLHLARGVARAQTGHIAGARSDLEAALREARDSGNQRAEMLALDELGFLLAGAADYRQATPLLESAQWLAQRLGDRGAEARILSRLSIVFTNQLKLERALVDSHRALSLARELGDKRALAVALDSLEVASVMIGDFGAVEDIARELALIHRAHGDLWYLQHALYQWAWSAIARCLWDEAIARLQEGLAVSRSIGDGGAEPIFHATLAWVHRSRGRYGDALKEGRLAASQAHAIGHPEFVSLREAVVGWVLLELNALEDAVGCLQRARTSAAAAGSQIQALRTTAHLALASHLLGRLEEAHLALDEAIHLIGEVRTPGGRAYLQGADAWIAVARVLLAGGRHEAAEHLLRPLSRISEAADWHEVSAGSLMVLGRCRAAHGDTPEAKTAIDRALEIGAAQGLPRVVFDARCALFQVLPRSPETQSHIAEARSLAMELSSRISDDKVRVKFLAYARSELEARNVGG